VILELAALAASLVAFGAGRSRTKEAVFECEVTVERETAEQAEIPAESPLDKISAVIESASSAGRLIRRIFVGADTFHWLCVHWGMRIGMTPAGPMIMTAQGSVPVELRPTLIGAVIAEDTTGEPWMSE
jgi:hypothetical protein